MKIEEVLKGSGYVDVEFLDGILNTPPPKEWLQEAPEIKKGWMYLPIDRVEFLLHRLFKNVNITISKVIAPPNAATVTVTVSFERDGVIRNFDGIGSAQVTNTNIQNTSMAFPLAKSLAIKDAMPYPLFGSNLNRRDVISITKSPKMMDDKDTETIADLILELSKATAAEINGIGVKYSAAYPLLKSVIKAECTKRSVELT